VGDELMKSMQRRPLFVTWNTITPKGDRRLRGCIGTFGPVPLESGLADYAKTR
jgi:AMMECR1 domain-containing protein